MSKGHLGLGPCSLRAASPSMRLCKAVLANLDEAKSMFLPSQVSQASLQRSLTFHLPSQASIPSVPAFRSVCLRQEKLVQPMIRQTASSAQQLETLGNGDTGKVCQRLCKLQVSCKYMRTPPSHAEASHKACILLVLVQGPLCSIAMGLDLLPVLDAPAGQLWILSGLSVRLGAISTGRRGAW